MILASFKASFLFRVKMLLRESASVGLGLGMIHGMAEFARTHLPSDIEVCITRHSIQGHQVKYSDSFGCRSRGCEVVTGLGKPSGPLKRMAAPPRTTVQLEQVPTTSRPAGTMAR